MAQNFCGKCGNRLAPDSRFCEVCGTRITRRTYTKAPWHKKQAPEGPSPLSKEPPKKTEEPVPAKPITAPSSPQKPSTQLQQSPPPIFTNNSRRKSRTWIIVAVVIFFSLLIAARAFHSADFALFHEKTYLGEKSYVIASKDPLDLRLEIENSAGDVSVTFAESTALLSARIKVWGDEDASLTDAASFSERNNGLTTTLTFDSSDDHSWDFFDHAGFSYDLIIVIANEARTDVVIDVSSGDITLLAQNPTTITGLDLETSSGGITADLGANSILACSESDISAASGAITLKWTDLIIERNTDWDLDSSSGTISIEMRQQTVPEESKRITFGIDVSSGNVVIVHALAPTVGLKFLGDEIPRRSLVREHQPDGQPKDL
jgi:hypothetical protein